MHVAGRLSLSHMLVIKAAGLYVSRRYSCYPSEKHYSEIDMSCVKWIEMQKDGGMDGRKANRGSHGTSGKKKKPRFLAVFKSVRPTGLEPVPIAGHAPQTCAYANSATVACRKATRYIIRDDA